MTFARVLWGFVVVWSLATSVYVLARMAPEPEWMPPVAPGVEASFGIKLGRRGGLLLVLVPTIILLTLPMWHPVVRRLVLGR